jgi:four helix bundle protein
MATIQRFEDMAAWQKARLLVKEIYHAMRPIRDPGFRDQIQRAAVSVLSNISEGFESGTKHEFINYLYIAKGSAGEVRAQLYAAFDIGYLNIETFKYLKGLAEECSRLTASFIEKLKAGGWMGLQNKLPEKESLEDILGGKFEYDTGKPVWVPKKKI